MGLEFQQDLWVVHELEPRLGFELGWGLTIEVPLELQFGLGLGL